MFGFKDYNIFSKIAIILKKGVTDIFFFFSYPENTMYFS